jgi:hypothetical protein
MKKKNSQFESGEDVKAELKGLYGLDPETSLLSVHFSPPENQYLNEHYQDKQE